MTGKALDKIVEAARQRVGKTTPAPWVAEANSYRDEIYCRFVRIEMKEADTMGILTGFTAPDVELISAAPDLQEAVLYLAERVKALEASATPEVQR